MCQELEDELKRGENAAKALIEHLEAMGADTAAIPVTTDAGCYLIKVVKTI
jgi:hypothetical protein